MTSRTCSITKTMSSKLPHSSGFSLGLEEGQDIAFSYWSLDVPKDVSVSFVAKLYSDLDTLTLGAGSAEHLGDLGVSWEVSFWVHVDVSKMSVSST